MTRLLLLVCFFFFLPAQSYAAHYNFVTLVFPPLEFEKDGQAQGAAVDIVRTIIKRLGHTATITIMPWERSLSLVREGKADAIFTAYRNPERELFLDYAKEVLVQQVISLYIAKKSGKTYRGSLKELVGQNIGVLSTISYGSEFDEAKEKLDLKTTRVEKLDLSFKMLLAGRLDYLISNRYSAEVEIEALGIQNEVTELTPPIEITPSYIAFSKKKNLSDLRRSFDEALLKIKQDGTYDTILAHYKIRAPR